MELQSKNNQCIESFYDSNDISLLKAFILFSVSIVFFGFMVACYHGVIEDNRFINDNPMFRMLQESESFMKNINDSVCANQFLKEYQWLKKFPALIHENCRIIPSNINYLQVINYIMSWYNMLLMNILFVTTSRVSALSYIPITIAFASSFVNSQEVFVLGLFNFSQILLSIIIIIIFIVVKERKINSSLVLEKDFNKIV